MAESNGTRFGSTVEALLNGMNTVLSTKTVVGEATRIGDTIILPLVDVTFGVAAGSNASAGKDTDRNATGAAGGIGGKMTPSAVLIVNKDGYVKLVNVKQQDSVTKVLDMIPDIISKFAGKGATVSDKDIVDAVFPEGEVPCEGAVPPEQA